jgi:hypothetical protein
MSDNDRDARTGRFFSAILEEYRIRLETIDKGRARSAGMLPVFVFAMLGYTGWYFLADPCAFNAATVIALVALAAFAASAVFLISAGSHKGLVRADVNALLKAAKLEDAEASSAMADIYIDRINDLDRMVERQERHFRSGAWLGFAFASMALLSFLLRALLG